MIKYTQKEFKTILNKRKFIDSWFWDRYGINGYNGCIFGCVYCDSRSSKYRLPTDFENDIIVKTNVKEMLDKRIANARTLLPDVVGMSGASDPYHPAEAKFQNTLQCLEVLEKHKYPVHIITKSTLVLRDLDLLDKIGQNNWCCVSVTITTTNTEVSSFLEGRAPSPQERFDIIKTIKETKTHIRAGVLLLPIVPFLCDSDDNLEEVFKKTKESQADYLLFGGMTMRDMQAVWFMKHLQEKYPELVKKYEDLYQFRYNPESPIYEGSYAPKGSYAIKINKKVLALCEKYRIPYRIKRYLPGDYRKPNYMIAEELLNEAYRLQVTGKAWSNMYWAGMNIQNLKESIAAVAARNELRKIRNVTNEILPFIWKNI
ncbi:MAG: radical SAM protein [Candidatus Aminicenantes bacterium]|nr:radical SAM protein [Candidatus Aminicenantes bacterium]NIM80661.1 radical SAM protein [Candidatus Aminicenantes bacterium]NIN20042.1 radical SAM protein [Candidatus Aminicenantes bacterium]NIN43830.1 radical SAM protein [Candidatus Aminicenantes bacterium]NIN86640.1 radical SAM protein [Candidatus Aminicenantes bacterium]